MTVPVREGTSSAEFLDSLTVKSVSDVTDVRSAFAGAFTRLRILLTPINFGNWLYYKAL